MTRALRLQINASNIDGATPLCDAANNGNVDCVQLLLSKGATVNPQLNYTTPLHEAILRGEAPFTKDAEQPAV